MAWLSGRRLLFHRNKSKSYTPSEDQNLETIFDENDKTVVSVWLILTNYGQKLMYSFRQIEEKKMLRAGEGIESRRKITWKTN